MKDNRKSPFVSSLADPVRGENHRRKFTNARSYVRFNAFEHDHLADEGSFFKDLLSSASYLVVKGVPSSGGSFVQATTSLTDADVYGETVYADFEVAEGVKMSAPLRQAGVRLPIDGTPVQGGAFIARPDARNFDPSDSRTNPGGVTVVLKGNFDNATGGAVSAQSLFMVADPGGHATFSIEFSAAGVVQVVHKTDGGFAAKSVTLPDHVNDQYMIFAGASTDSANRYVDFLRVYDLHTGELVHNDNSYTSDPGNVIALSNPHVAIGYGAANGGWNPAYTAADYLVGPTIYEASAFRGLLSEEECGFIARSHLEKIPHKSGFNNRSIDRVLQLRDAEKAYPDSAHPEVVPTKSSPFNDESTIIFGEVPVSGSVEGLVYPEALPAYMFSGSTLDRGATTDKKPFYRDVHNTNFDKRLVAPGKMRPGVFHEDTFRLDKATRNSPPTLSQDTAILGGTIQPFDDSHPLIDVYKETAVSDSVYFGLQQRRGDHVAIVIDLNPTESTKIGAPEPGDPDPKVTSMAYFNFATKTWETAGKNNDFVVPPAVLISTSTLGGGVSDLRNVANKRISVLQRVGTELFASASVAFAGTSGFTIRKAGVKSLEPLKTRGLPTSNYGFPVDGKYEAKDDQLIDIGKYIDAPFLLERVSFEFGAGIEDSGPHSMGYVKRFLNAEEGPDLRKRAPVMGVRGHSFTPALDKGEGIKVNFPRAEFINGSEVIPEFPSTAPYSWDSTYTFLSSSAAPLRRLLLGNDPSVDDTGSRLRLLMVNNWNELSGQGNLDTEHPATMLLKTQLGPRRDGQPTDGTQRNWTVDGVKYPVSYIPILAGGINGVVTGTMDTEFWGVNNEYGPYVTIQPNALDTKSNSSLEGTDWVPYQAARGGTPFWRADSFFLLKQSKKPSSVVYRRDLKITAGYGHVAFPLAPYAGTTQEWRSQFLRVMSDGQPTLGASNREMYGIGYATGALGGGGSKTLTVEFNSDTTRELITFGQMTHFGYANAADSYMDSLYNVEGTSQGVHVGISSASHNDVFLDQIMPSAGASRGRRNVPLFGQAIKYANLSDFSWTAIPANVEKPKGDFDTSGRFGTSVFSDLPDTQQGQYSYNPYLFGAYAKSEFEDQAGDDAKIAIKGVKQWLWEAGKDVRPSTSTTAIPGAGYHTKGNYPVVSEASLQQAQINLSSILKGPLIQRNRWGSARYALSGAAPGSAAEMLPNQRETAQETLFTLDTFAPYPLVATGSAMWGSLDVSSYYAGTVHDPQKGPYNNSWRINGLMKLQVTQMTDFLGNQVYSSSPSSALYFRAPQGSGLSVISTPAYLADEVAISSEFASGSVHFQEYGTFFSSSIIHDVPSWLDAGLSRDTNIFLSRGARHEGVNHDFSDNFCGFTLMTASTVHRPYESPGRESAALPLVANVYKRQWLNYRRKFKIDVPIRVSSPTFVEAPGYWTFTSENPMYEMGNGNDEDPFRRAMKSHPLPFPREGAWDPSTTDRTGPGSGTELWKTNGDYQPMKDRFGEFNQIARGSKLYHTRFNVSITEGGWTPGANLSGINSARFFTARTPGSAPADFTAQGPLTFGYHFWNPDVGDSNTTPLSNIGIDDVQTIVRASELSGSFAKKSSQESLYLLQPGDKLILGVQPSLPGWNEGSGLPNNRTPLPWGPWNTQASYSDGFAQLRSKPSGAASTSDLSFDQPMNMEDPYEPSHGMTMLEGPSRLVLYGTFLRNNKYYSPSSKQSLNSKNVHEAIHFDNPVVDQYLIGDLEDYDSSYLTQHVVGDIFSQRGPDDTTGRSASPRAVVATAEDGNLTISGSFQRFTRAAEVSQVYYDTLMQDPFEIAVALGGSIRTPGGQNNTLSGYSVVSLHLPTSNAVNESVGMIGEQYPYAFASGWGESFPFEAKFKNVTRLTTMETSFGGQRSAVIRIAPPDVASTTLEAGPLTGMDSVSGFLSLQSGPQGNRISPTTGSFPSSAIVTYTPGIDVASISNMANVRVGNGLEILPAGTTWAQRGSLTYPPRGSDKQSQRLFFAAMVGYGRTNRRQLDFREWRFLNYQASAPSPPGYRGVVYCDHPAGIKYGYMNSDHLSPSTVHRGDRFGQFRDMLEQRLYSKVYSYGDDFNRRGESEAAVSCIFVDADGSPITDASQTQCLNLSTAMTSSKPYIEGEVLREIIFSSESVTVE